MAFAFCGILSLHLFLFSFHSTWWDFVFFFPVEILRLFFQLLMRLFDISHFHTVNSIISVIRSQVSVCGKARALCWVDDVNDM